MFGVTEYKTGVLDIHDPNFMKVHNCIVGANMNSDTLYEVAVQYFRAHPKSLTEPTEPTAE